VIKKRQPAAAKARDVLVMTSHDIGRRLRCYGLDSVVSPHLDSLAAGGVRFDRAFCTAPQCSPSRASLATGRYPHNNGVMGLAHAGFDWELSPSTPHTAAFLAGAGFETHLFGMQHVSLHPERIGFDHMHAPGRQHGNATGQIIAAAVEKVLKGAPAERRLYLEVNFEETHRPYPTVGASATGSEGMDVPGYLPAGPEAAAELQRLQVAIEDMDAAAGRVLAALDRAGRAEKTLVVFTTDHGLAMPRAKCTLYDPGLEVSLIVRWPAGDIGSGSVRPEMVSNIDVLPTILEAAGARVPTGIQGRSFLPLMRGDAYEPRDAIFAEKTFHSYYDPMRCVRTRSHKYIRNFETAFAVEVPGDIQQGAVFRADPSRYSADRTSVAELYDLDADPLEQHNLAGSRGIEAIEQQLSSALWTWMRETEDPLLKGPISSPRYRQAMQP
jgi:N-sulfoglucosamine sulfohydrolase